MMSVERMSSRNQISLETCRDICVTLENIVKPSFGPNALACMLCSNTGKVQVTSRGVSILGALHISHPLGRMIISSIQTHQQHTGDGSKAALLVVTEFLRRLMRRTCTRDNQPSADSCRAQFIRGLSVITQTFIPDHIIPLVYSHAKCLNKTEDYKTLQTFCFNIVKTSLQGRYNRNTCHFLADLLSSFILPDFLCDCRSFNLNDLIVFLLDHFEEIFVSHLSKPITASQIIDGVILQRPLMAMSRTGTGKPLGKVKFVLVGYEIGTDDGVSPSSVAISSRDHLQMNGLLSWKHKHISSIVSYLHQKDVNLIICGEHVPETLVYLCQIKEIAVIQCLPEEDLKHIALLGNINIVYEYCDFFSESVIATAKEYCPILVDGQQCVKLTEISPSRKLCPSCTVHENSEFVGSDEKNYQSCENNHHAKYDESWGASGTGQGSNHQHDNLMGSKHRSSHKRLLHESVGHYMARQVLLCAPSPGLCAQLKASVYDAIRCVKSWWMGEEQPAYGAWSIAGGGSFEFLIHKAFHLKAASVSDPYLRHLYDILSEAWLSIPLNLLRNSYTSSSRQITTAHLHILLKNSGSYLSSQPELFDTGKHIYHEDDTNIYRSETAQKRSTGGSDPCKSSVEKSEAYSEMTIHMPGVDARNGKGLLADTSVLEPLSNKINLLYFVMNLLIQIMRVDSIVSVRHLPPPSSDDEIDNSE